MNLGRPAFYTESPTAECLFNQITVSLIIDVEKAGIDVSCKKKKQTVNWLALSAYVMEIVGYIYCSTLLTTLSTQK